MKDKNYVKLLKDWQGNRTQAAAARALGVSERGYRYFLAGAVPPLLRAFLGAYRRIKYLEDIIEKLTCKK